MQSHQSREQLKTIGHYNEYSEEFLAEELAEIFRAVSDPTRLKILYMIALNPPEELTGAAIGKALNISPPTVTHHMNKLEDAGFISRFRVGRKARYEVCSDIFSHFNMLVRALADGLDY